MHTEFMSTFAIPLSVPILSLVDRQLLFAASLYPVVPIHANNVGAGELSVLHKPCADLPRRIAPSRRGSSQEMSSYPKDVCWGRGNRMWIILEFALHRIFFFFFSFVSDFFFFFQWYFAGILFAEQKTGTLQSRSAKHLLSLLFQNKSFSWW